MGTYEPASWEKVVGIVGGLGPHAHIRFEELLLREAETRAQRTTFRDQDYPPYIVSSIPRTPDRTKFVQGKGPSPLPWLERGLRSLRGAPDEERLNADFAVIACNTAHVLLPELRAKAILPILDLVGETVAAVRRSGSSGKVGLLATTGTLESSLYQQECREQGLAAFSLLDLPHGTERQQALVMDVIYGADGRPGIKAGAHRDPEHRGRLLEGFERAVELLADAGAGIVLAACTEIPLVLEPGRALGTDILDPLEIAARAALEVAAGEREVAVPSGRPAKA